VPYTGAALGRDLLRFDTFELDTSTGELQNSGTPVRLPPQPSRVLGLLASNAGALVTRDELRGRIWSGDTFVDFEQGLNFCIKQIRAALGDDAKAPKYIETLPRRGYRFLARVERVADAPRRVTLAVLPFENVGGDADQEYFSDGLTDEMITQLGRLNPDELRIVGRTSSMQYKNTRKTVAEIGAELGVSYVLEGSVRRAGDRMRVTTRLVRAADQSQVWTESYDRNVDDILAVQSDTAYAVAREVNVKLSPRGARRLAVRRPVGTQAHEAYLRGRHFWNQRTQAGFKKGIEHFTSAIASEPEYAEAYDGICDSYVMLACRGVLPVRETFDKAKDAARKALAIDPELGEAHASLAHVRLHAWDWNGLDADFQRALELSPGHAIAHYWHAEYLMAMGRTDEAVAKVRTARDMDPLSAVLNSSLSMILYLARRFDEAAAVLRSALDVNPDHFLLHFRLGLISTQSSAEGDAVKEMERAVELSGRSTEALAGLAQAYAAGGRRAEMQSVIDELMRESSRRYVSPYNLSRAWAAARDDERVFMWLERAHEERNPDLIELRTEPVFDAVRHDPRFDDLLHRVGWRA
jgi:TolB-like protein/Tfp pilus assembly protein PilF